MNDKDTSEKLKEGDIGPDGLPVTGRDTSPTRRHQETTKVKGSFQPDVPIRVGEGLFSGKSK